jgi:predicted nuclease with TOPRIM domain
LDNYDNVLMKYDRRQDEFEEKLDDTNEFRESWLERNTAAEGEVTILRERVDRQDEVIKRLETDLRRMMMLLVASNTPLAGE